MDGPTGGSMDGLTLYTSLLDGFGSAIQQSVPSLVGACVLALYTDLLALIVIVGGLIVAANAARAIITSDTWAAGWPLRSGRRLWELMECDRRRYERPHKTRGE